MKTARYSVCSRKYRDRAGTARPGAPEARIPPPFSSLFPPRRAVRQAGVFSGALARKPKRTEQGGLRACVRLPLPGVCLYGGLILLECLLWGLGNPLIKIGGQGIAPFSSIALRFSLAFLAFVLVFGRRVWRGLRGVRPGAVPGGLRVHRAVLHAQQPGADVHAGQYRGLSDGGCRALFSLPGPHHSAHALSVEDSSGHRRRLRGDVSAVRRLRRGLSLGWEKFWRSCAPCALPSCWR